MSSPAPIPISRRVDARWSGGLLPVVALMWQWEDGEWCAAVLDPANGGLRLADGLPGFRGLVRRGKDG